MTQSQDYDFSWQKKTALFLISQNISLFGSSVVAFTIVWYITLETSSLGSFGIEWALMLDVYTALLALVIFSFLIVSVVLLIVVGIWYWFTDRTRLN